MYLHGKSIRSWCDVLSDQSFMVDPLGYFSVYQRPYYVCGMMHIKEPLLLIEKSSLYGGSGFPLSLSEWFFTICLTPYNRK